MRAADRGGRLTDVGLPRNREEAIRVDWRLPVFGGDDDGGRIQKTFVLERSDHLPDGCIHEYDFLHHQGSGRTLRRPHNHLSCCRFALRARLRD